MQDKPTHSKKKKLPTKGQRLGWKSIHEKESLNFHELLDKDTKIVKPERPRGSTGDF